MTRSRAARTCADGGLGLRHGVLRGGGQLDEAVADVRRRWLLASARASDSAAARRRLHGRMHRGCERGLALLILCSELGAELLCSHHNRAVLNVGALQRAGIHVRDVSSALHHSSRGGDFICRG